MHRDQAPTRKNDMGTVVSRIQNFNLSLTPSELKVAEYLQKNPEIVVEVSIHEVAKNAGVSVASVSRLANTLGYRDWKELRTNLIKDLNDTSRITYSDLRGEDSEETIIKKIFDCSVLSLNDTFAQMDKADALKAVDAVKNTDRIVFFGTGRSGCFAREQSLRFAFLDLSAEAYTDEYQMFLHASRMRKGQVAFGFSNSGRSRATVEALALARKTRALTIGIANYRNTPLEDVSDIYFCTSFPRVGEISASLTARLALLCIMDVIYILAAKRGEKSLGLEDTDAFIDKTLRVSPKVRQNGKP